MPEGERNQDRQISVLDSHEVQRYLSREILEKYRKDLEACVQRYGISRYLGPADHFAVKVEDGLAFENLIKVFKPFCVLRAGKTPGLSIRQMHGRRIAVALLETPIEFAGSLVNCIEIMEPRPEVAGKDVVGLDHLELINPAIQDIERHLRASGADFYIDSTNPYKEIAVVFVNDGRERLKFTNKTLAEIVPLQISDEPHRVEVVLG